MYRIVWEYDAAPDRLREFESEYGSSGRWVDFFRRSEDYVSTELFRSLDSPTRFMTLDCWRTRAGYEAFRKAHAEDYSRIDEQCAQLTAHERMVGMVDDGK